MRCLSYSLHYQTLLLGSAGINLEWRRGWFSEDEWIQLEDEVFISAGHISWFFLLTICQNVPSYYSLLLSLSRFIGHFPDSGHTWGHLLTFVRPYNLPAINLEIRGWDDFSITTQYCTMLHVICFSFLFSLSNSRVYPITKSQEKLFHIIHI